MGLKARHQLSAVIPTASIADLAFFLIIYFMVTITHEKDLTPLVLPESRARFELPTTASYISLTQDGQIRVTTGEAVCGPASQDHSIDIVVASFKGDYPERAVILKADTAVPYKHVDRVLDSLKRARIDKIYFQTQQKTVD